MAYFQIFSSLLKPLSTYASCGFHEKEMLMADCLAKTALNVVVVPLVVEEDIIASN